ncbi:MAG: Eco57I restriction-modification methylase domain-containing protein [Muribaculaceae bacterium]|nr:Eco57I restriction-modification methylase domain-containing protein [Muribaculaceae bacterium]
MKFDVVIGNPPYQEETENISLTNGQLRSKSIFHHFQMIADIIANTASVLIYPGGRWLQRSGKGMNDFGLTQINDKRLQTVYFYPDSKEVFPNVAIADGITIVVKLMQKKDVGFNYIFCEKQQTINAKLDNPGNNIIPLNPNDSIIVKKIEAFVKANKMNFLHTRVHPQKLFAIESDFIEKNANIARVYNDGDKYNWVDEVKLYANDKAGKAGRTKWFIIPKKFITNNSEYINKWKVVVSSANAGGQKRDNQLEIIDNHSAFGRSRVALASFDTLEEAKNFYKYVKSYIIKFAFLMTDEALTTLAMKVPDISNYTSKNKFINFSKDIDTQLCSLLGITSSEYDYLKNKVDNLR